MRTLIAVIGMIACASAAAMPLGPVWPVVEPDLLTLLELRVREAESLGLFRSEQAKASKRFEAHRRIPVAIDLPRSGASSVRTFALWKDANLGKLPETVREQVLALQRTYFLLDADDRLQVDWVRRESAGRSCRIVTLAGDRERLETELMTPVFSDQGGALRRRFGIEALPARVDIHGIDCTVSFPALRGELP